jgi:pentatricopeptide repeat protein
MGGHNVCVYRIDTPCTLSRPSEGACANRCERAITMPTPLICRKCAARLFTSTLRLARSNRRLLHTSVVQPGQPILSRTPQPEQEHKKTSVAPGLIRPNPEANATRTPTKEPQQLWHDEPKKYEPQELLHTLRKIVKNAQHTSASRQLFQADAAIEIKSASDEHNPFIELFSLSSSEALHAVDQLKRLLQSHTENETVLARLDEYVAWKTHWSALLKKPVVASTVSEEKEGINDAEYADFKRTTVESMMSTWQRLDQDDRECFWPRFINFALESEQHLLPAFIQTTFDPSWCQNYVVEDVLYLLYRQYSSTRPDDATGGDPVLKKQIRAIASHVLKNCSPGYLVLEQTVLSLFFWEVPTSELPELLHLLGTIQHPLRPPTLLHIASRFAKDNTTKHRAKDLLDSLTKEPSFDINTPAASSVCTSLLNLKEGEPFPDEQAAPDVLFKFLLERGWRPNLLGMTALIHNFCVRRHLEPAWKTFDLMVHLGLTPDHHVSSILLKASKKNMDVTRLGRIFRAIKSGTGWSVTSFNHFLSFMAWSEEYQLKRQYPYSRIPRRQRKTEYSPWRLMLRYYSNFFNLAPLQKFMYSDLRNMGRKGKRDEPLFTEKAEETMAKPRTAREQPDSNTLYIMLDAALRSLTTPEQMLRHYHRFLMLVKNQDSTALALLADRHTGMYDIYIRNLMQFRMTAGFAVRQFIKMMEDAKKEQVRLGGHNQYHHPPSVHTWTCILNGLKNHRHLDGVVSVFDMMVNIGNTQPNLAAWNILIETFAMEKNVRGAVKALWSLEAAGLQPNESTTTAFGRFPQVLKKQAISLIERLRSKSPELTSAFDLKFATLEKFNARHEASRIGRYNGPTPAFVFTLEELAEQLESEEWIGRKQELVVNRKNPFRKIGTNKVQQRHLSRKNHASKLEIRSSKPSPSSSPLSSFQ